MQKIKNLMIEQGILAQEDFVKKSFEFEAIFLKIMSNMGKLFLGFFALLFFGVLAIESYKATLVIMTISSFVWLIKSKNSFLAPVVFITSLDVSMGLIAEVEEINLYFILSFIIFNLICFVIKNKQMLNLYIPVLYLFLLIIPINEMTTYTEYIKLLSIINFGLALFLIVNEERIRKSSISKQYLFYLVEILLTGFGIAVWYEWINISGFFRESTKNSFVYIHNIIYVAGNIYLLWRLKKSSLLSNNIILISFLLILISLKIPIISYVLFIFTLSLLREWYMFYKISFGLIIISTFLTYHTFTSSFVTKSIITFSMGIIMLLSYIVIKRREKLEK